jgi:catalase-peroxidase
MMFTTDMALKMDPIYEKISEALPREPRGVRRRLRRAWFKLTHRDMGPRTRYLGPEVPEALIWQDPVPAVDHELVDSGHRRAQGRSSRPVCPSRELVATAWASASTFRDTDKRGGANGARIRLAPQKDWAVNEPGSSKGARRPSSKIQTRLQRAAARQEDLAGRPDRARRLRRRSSRPPRTAGVDVKVPFTPGRTDATQEQTDAESFAVLEPKADGFRNYLTGGARPCPRALVDRPSCSR